MFTGFQKIIEERILRAQKLGQLDNLQGSGKPIEFDDTNVPEDLKMAYKILKNADYLPPEIELKKEIQKTEDLLAGMKDEAERYKLLKKLNFMILKLNAVRDTSISHEMPQHYLDKLATRITPDKKGK